MLFKVDPRIFKEFPGTVIGVVAAHGITNKKSDTAVTDLLKKTQEHIVKEIKKEEIKEHPHINVWREAYKKFGAKPKDYLPSVENLITRIINGKPFGSVNTLVDLYNIISLKYLLPAGGEDLATISGNIELTFANDKEKAILLLGEKEVRAPEVGEVFYKDENGAICRRWNWKEADRTKLTEQTVDAVLVLEGLPPISKEYIMKATHELATLIERYCGGTATVGLITENNPEVVLKKGNNYVPLQAKQSVNLAEKPQHMTKDYIDHQKVTSQEHQIRIQKVEKMRAAGLQPWPEFKEVTATTEQVLAAFKDEQPSPVYAIAGRVIALRKHGKTAFAHLQDRTGTLQIYIRHDDIGDAFTQFDEFIDIGDILWVQGPAFRTKMGEVTLKVQNFQLLSKSLYPLPEKFHGLTDVETKYRQRYLDLISNKESRARFIKRSHIIKIIRNYLDRHDFVEVETPMLHPIPGGAEARPFVTHHNALGMDLYLRIAPELYLKRLVIGGMERVYEINRCFRNEGISTKHNPEFTTIELYIAHEDYRWMMDFSEKMLKEIVQEINGDMVTQFGDHRIDFGKPFERISMRDAVIKYGTIAEKDLSKKTIDATLKKHGVTLDKKNASWGEKLYALFDELVESKLIQPTFITHFPVEVSPLAKRDPANPELVLRFEMFIAGMEISNAFNELNDPFDQAERFHEQARAKEAGNQEAHHYDADFVHALEYALPPTVGFGMGIDRLAMLLTGTQSIKDVILFPTLKQK